MTISLLEHPLGAQPGQPGDRSAIRCGQRTLEVEVLTVADNVGKAEAAAMYREIMDSPS